MYICRECDTVYDDSIFCMTEEDWEQWNDTSERYRKQGMCDKCLRVIILLTLQS